jgi:L-alanine-DL-glutamate epimerase-like enolase superfamily enzyme
MNIQTITYDILRIPLKFQFSQSNNTTSSSSAIIMKLTTEQGTQGFGECCPRAYVTGESLDSVRKDVDTIQNLLYAQSFKAIEDIRQFVVHELSDKVGLSTICGIDLALMDAWGKEHQQHLVEVVGGKKNRKVQYTGIVPQGNALALKKALNQLRFFQFKELKIKVNDDLEKTLETIQLIRSEYFPAVKLRVDANCAWRYEDAIVHIPRLLEEGIEVFEQIFSKDQLDELKKITAKFGADAKIMADESLTTYQSGQYLIDNKICNHFNMKISKNGGFWNTLRLYDLIQENGLTCQLGAHFGETSLLTATGLLLASKADKLTAIEGGYGDYLLEQDFVQPSIKFDRHAQIHIEQAFPATGLCFK